MPYRPSIALVAFPLLGLLCGCETTRANRIREKAELFAAQPAAVQALIREGMVDYGFTPELVHLALGEPNRRQSGEAAEGRMETWTYKNIVLSDTVAMRVGMNNPGSRYQPGRLLSPNAPGGPSISSTRNVGPQPGVADMADVRTGTLFVEFLNGRVFSLRLE
jgi:hypothetical protein